MEDEEDEKETPESVEAFNKMKHPLFGILKNDVVPSFLIRPLFSDIMTTVCYDLSDHQPA